MRRTVTGALGIGLLDAVLLEALPVGAAASAEAGLAASGGDERRAALAALRPRIHTRSEWGARPPRKRAKVLRRAPKKIVVHHTATPNYRDDSLAHAYWLSRWIQRHHMRVRGWADTGQQLTISRGGHVMEGRNRTLSAIRLGRLVVGAHVRGHNRHAIGIENEGTYTNAEVPGPLWDSLERVCAWLCARYDLDPYRAIVGHRDFADTECPGDVLYDLLPDLRHRVADRLERATGRARPKKRRAGKQAAS
ncbi:MAG: N-acetylmuramoyl-L-alanine amidase [Actinomadura rubrobrunea]|nr:N-acetylmuramoyl-L-alanine amidase [Actinomadura rubrobrunea]